MWTKSFEMSSRLHLAEDSDTTRLMDPEAGTGSKPSSRLECSHAHDIIMDRTRMAMTCHSMSSDFLTLKHNNQPKRTNSKLNQY